MEVLAYHQKNLLVVMSFWHMILELIAGMQYLAYFLVKNYNIYIAFFFYSNSFHTHGAGNKSGFIGIEMGFKTKLSKPIKLIIYSVYHSVLSVDVDRNAKLEYAI